MRTIGISCPPVPGHANPMFALAKELQSMGHKPVFLAVPDMEESVRKYGVGFAGIGEAEYPVGNLQLQLALLGRLSAMAAFKKTMELCLEGVQIQFRDMPDAIRRHGIDSLLVDDGCWAGATVAQHMGLPYVSVANALAFSRDPQRPPCYTMWQPSDSPFARMRNKACAQFENFSVRSVSNYLNDQRARWSLPPNDMNVGQTSKLAHVSQCPAAFDFPGGWSKVYHPVGPLRRPELGNEPFPFERLDGRPLVYVSMGSLLAGKRHIFATIAEACAPLNVQLVMTHCRLLRDEETVGFAGDPIVVPWAPQMALLERASLAVSHAGLNTVLDILSLGLPSLLIPLAYDQPGAAARAVWHGASLAIAPKKLTVDGARRAIEELLSNTSYKTASQKMAAAFGLAGGVRRAAQIIDRAFATGAPVPTDWQPSAQQRSQSMASL